MQPSSASTLSEFLQIKKIKLSNGETLAYREVGSASQVLILLHGTWASSAHFYHIAPLLSPYFHVIALDMRGFGNSTYNNPISTHEELADDIKLFVDEMKISKCSMLGWSTGGGIAVYFAAKYPENVDKIILLASLGPQGVPKYKVDPNGQKERITRKEDLKDLFTSVVVAAVDKGDREFMEKNFDAFVTIKPAEDVCKILVDETMMQKHFIVIDEANFMFNVTDEDNGILKGDGMVKKVKCKTLVIQGEQDSAIDVEVAKKWKKFMGDLVTEKFYSDGTHNLFNNHLSDVAEDVKSFFLPFGDE